MGDEKNIMRYYRYSIENVELIFEEEDEPISIEKGLVSDIFIEKELFLSYRNLLFILFWFNVFFIKITISFEMINLSF